MSCVGIPMPGQNRHASSVIHQLVAQQLDAIESALSFNKMIQRSLDTNGWWHEGQFHFTQRGGPYGGQREDVQSEDSGKGFLGSSILGCLASPQHLPSGPASSPASPYAPQRDRAPSPTQRSVTFARPASAGQAPVSLSEVKCSLERPLLEAVDGEDCSDAHEVVSSDDGQVVVEEVRVSPHQSPQRHVQHRGSSRVFSGLSREHHQVQESLSGNIDTHDETDRYDEQSCAAKLVKHSAFEHFTMSVLFLNTVWIGICTDFNNGSDIGPHGAMIFAIVDNFICAVFTFEIVARFLAFKIKFDALQEFWFMFDMLLVLTMVWETWLDGLMSLLLGAKPARDTYGHTSAVSSLRILRILRILRAARLIRLIRMVPELACIVKSMGAACRGMLVVLVFLLLVVYVFAILLCQLLSGQEVAAGRFDYVLEAMNFMMLQVLCGFDSDLVMKMLDFSWTAYALWLTFVVLASLMVLNMLVGMLCEVVSAAAEYEKEAIALKELEYAIELLDTDGSCSIASDELDDLLNTPSMIRKLDELGIDVSAFMEFAHFVFEDRPELTLTDFAAMMVQFRGTKQATVKDIVDLRKYVTMEVSHLEKLLLENSERLMSSGASCQQVRC
eukprot:TRINITY_DN41405_c0_g1_i1.p1 TRINITY_DN41405_c0_g1~~TRINITY_DN41405_c0_g1_i1.p1  ORF type:complete len:630 (-),score=123.02 TRINITY_DN41405_c0_g1_i1:20-1861(-)